MATKSALDYLVNNSTKPKKKSKKNVKQTTLVKNKGDKKYINARSSKVKNVGKDVLGSKRHKWWEDHHFTLEEAEKENLGFEVITKDKLFPKLDIEIEIKKGKSAGHIYYHNYIRRSILRKPEDSKEARKIYVREIKNIIQILEKTTEIDELISSINKYRYSFHNDYAEFYKILSVMGNKFFNILKQSNRKKKYEAKDLDYTNYWRDKRDVSDYDKLRELLSPKSKKKKRKSIGDDIVSWRKQQLLKFKIDESKISKNKTPIKVKNDFNFSGVQWGNYVSDKERKLFVNLLYSAFEDFAYTLGINKKQLSLNGTLAIAIGARGSGRALAHYEPHKKIINLTKSKGNGCIAHEWGHAFDFMLNESIIGGNKKGIIGYRAMAINKDIPLEKKIQLKKDIYDLGYKLRNSLFYLRSSKIGGAYWVKNEELFARAFESFIGDFCDNKYLAFSTKGDPAFSPHCIYPQNEERKEINQLISNLFKTLIPIWDIMFGEIKSDVKEVSVEKDVGFIEKSKYRDKQGRPITLFMKKTHNSFKIGYIDYLLRENRIGEFYFTDHNVARTKLKAYNYYTSWEDKYNLEYTEYK